MIKLSATKKLILGAMTVALTVLCVYAAGVIPTMRAVVYFISSLFVYVLLCEKAYGMAVLSYLASSVLCFLIVPDKLSTVPYILLLGHFGIFKVFIDRNVKDRFIGFVLKLVYCNIFMTVGVCLALYVFDVGTILEGTEPSVWILIAAAQALFILLNALYTFCQQFYDTKLRFLIVSQR